MRCGLEVEVYLVAPLCRHALARVPCCKPMDRSVQLRWWIVSLWCTRTVAAVTSSPCHPIHGRCVQGQRGGEVRGKVPRRGKGSRGRDAIRACSPPLLQLTFDANTFQGRMRPTLKIASFLPLLRILRISFNSIIRFFPRPYLLTPPFLFWSLKLARRIVNFDDLKGEGNHFRYRCLAGLYSFE